MLRVNVSHKYEEKIGEASSMDMTISEPLYAALLTFACVTNIVGNSCIVLTILKHKQLRPVQCFYILNLAVADLCIAVFVLPIMIVWYAFYDDWIFGILTCKIMLVIYYIMLLELVCTILLISYDRYLIVTDGARYNLIQTKHRVLVKIGMTWIFSCIFQGPPIIGWEYWRGHSTMKEGDCYPEYIDSVVFTSVLTSLTFFIPLTLVSVFSILTILAIRKRSSSVTTGNIEYKKCQTPGLHHKYSDVAIINISRNERPNINNIANSKINEITIHARAGIITGASAAVNTTIDTSTTHNDKRTYSTKKATFSLVLVVVIFMLCWLPSNVTYLINAYCGGCVKTFIFEIVDFILWLNPSLNPFIYFVTNCMFRKALISMICHPSRSKNDEAVLH